MLLILISIVVAAVIAGLLMRYEERSGYYGRRTRHTVAGVVGFILALVVGVSTAFYMFVGFEWLAADPKSQIINREYGTQYTQKEVFFASDVIDTVRQLDRKRIEVNGNLMRDQEKQP